MPSPYTLETSPPEAGRVRKRRRRRIAIWPDRLDNGALTKIERETVRRLRMSILTGEAISTIAADLGLTPRRHRQAFRAVAGVSPDHLRDWMRIDLLLDLLHADTMIDGHDLAAAIGLPSCSDINRLTTRLTGEDLETWRTLIAYDRMAGRTRRIIGRERPNDRGRGILPRSTPNR